MTVERGSLAWADGTVSALWHHPQGGETYLVLGHARRKTSSQSWWTLR